MKSDVVGGRVFEKEDEKPQRDVILLLDRSGSMESMRPDIISGFNGYLAALKVDLAAEFDLRLTLITFSNEATVEYAYRALDAVPKLTPETYVPAGGTALYDAVASATVKPRAANPPLCVIITDGQENASKETTKDQVQELIRNREAQGWTFIYLSSDLTSWESDARAAGMSANSSAFFNHISVGRTLSAGASSGTREWAVTGTVNARAFVPEDEETQVIGRYAETTGGTSVGGSKRERKTGAKTG